MAKSGKGDSKGRGENSGQGATSEGAGAPQPLTDREEWVCREFIADAGENKTRAYMKVFKGCTYDSARTLAAKFFADVRIMNRVNELREERNKRLEISADKVLAGLAKLAFYDSRDFFDDDGRLRPISELDPDHADVVAGIETVHKVSGDADDGVTITTKIKLADRGQNLERLGKHLKLFTDRTEITGKDGGPVTFNDIQRSARIAALLADARKRAGK